MKPWWAISIVSVATFGESGFSDGPVQRTGTTSSSPHWATIVPSAVLAWICPVLRPSVERRVPPVTILVNHLATFSVSLVSGLDSLMFGYLILLGNCQTKPLLPPSSRCSITTSAPSPSQLLNAPRPMSSSSTTKHTLTAGSESVAMVILLGCGALEPSMPQVQGVPGAFAVQPQLRFQAA